MSIITHTLWISNRTQCSPPYSEKKEDTQGIYTFQFAYIHRHLVNILLQKSSIFRCIVIYVYIPSNLLSCAAHFFNQYNNQDYAHLIIKNTSMLDYMTISFKGINTLINSFIPVVTRTFSHTGYYMQACVYKMRSPIIL